MMSQAVTIPDNASAILALLGKKGGYTSYTQNCVAIAKTARPFEDLA